VATLLLPWHVTVIPRFLLLRELGLYNTLGALVVPTFLGDAFSIFLLRQFFLTIPEELSEAARLDGCGEWRIFWRIVLPLARPALATVALFQFIAAWNDFSGPLVYLNDPTRFPLAYGLEQFVSSYSSQTNLLMAAAVLFTLPIVILFFFTQRTFLRGITTQRIATRDRGVIVAAQRRSEQYRRVARANRSAVAGNACLSHSPAIRPRRPFDGLPVDRAARRSNGAARRARCARLGAPRSRCEPGGLALRAPRSSPCRRSELARLACG
jgi:hypothetical protein